jgi:hypothetical protein
MIINNEQEYMAAFKEIDQLWEQEDSPRLLELLGAVDAYDNLHYPIVPIDADYAERVMKLVEGVDVDLDAPIEDNDEQ